MSPITIGTVAFASVFGAALLGMRLRAALPEHHHKLMKSRTHNLFACGFVLVETGCSGINASKSISPLDFLLPGLMDNRSPPPVIPIQTNTKLAQASQCSSLDASLPT